MVAFQPSVKPIDTTSIYVPGVVLDSIDFDTQELICVRIATQTEYHFMKYDAETNAWYNKIGYGEIFKYVDNNGIPSNNIYWISSNHTYSGDIAYIIYDKLQINVNSSGYSSKNIIIQGCETGYSARDAFYEIVVPNSCEYTIQLSTEYSVHNFNYEIYSYNLYNGNYQILAQGSGNSTNGVTETVNLASYDDYNDGSENWQYQAYRYYIRFDFGRVNTSDVTVNVNITHIHDYIHSYDQPSSTQHIAYCECGESILENHRYNQYPYYNSIYHKAICDCGYETTAQHVINTTVGRVGVCIYCGETVFIGNGTVSPWGSNEEDEMY